MRIDIDSPNLRERIAAETRRLNRLAVPVYAAQEAWRAYELPEEPTAEETAMDDALWWAWEVTADILVARWIPNSGLIPSAALDDTFRAATTTPEWK